MVMVPLFSIAAWRNGVRASIIQNFQSSPATIACTLQMLLGLAVCCADVDEYGGEDFGGADADGYGDVCTSDDTGEYNSSGIAPTIPPHNDSPCKSPRSTGMSMLKSRAAVQS